MPDSNISGKKGLDWICTTRFTANCRPPIYSKSWSEYELQGEGGETGVISLAKWPSTTNRAHQWKGRLGESWNKPLLISLKGKTSQHPVILRGEDIIFWYMWMQCERWFKRLKGVPSSSSTYIAIQVSLDIKCSQAYISLIQKLRLCCDSKQEQIISSLSNNEIFNLGIGSNHRRKDNLAMVIL